MAQFKDITNHKSTSEEMKTSTLEVAVLFIKTLLMDPAALIRFRVMRHGEERYIRPPRPYDLPVFHQDMRYCISDEKYLRPTLYCNPHEPEVISMATKLGAYKLPDHEFAEAALKFVKHNMQLEVCPFNNVAETLKRGTGTCYHLINVFVALCRAAGIKARYKAFSFVLREDQRNLLLGMDPLFGKMYEAVNMFSQGEAHVDGKWLDADVALSAEMDAVRGQPITKLGEGLIGSQSNAGESGTVKHFESMPSFLTTVFKVQKFLMPAVVERINVAAQRQNTLGRKIIEEAGGKEAYDQKAREKLKLFSPITDFKDSKAIVFEE